MGILPKGLIACLVLAPLVSVAQAPMRDLRTVSIQPEAWQIVVLGTRHAQRLVLVRLNGIQRWPLRLANTVCRWLLRGRSLIATQVSWTLPGVPEWQERISV